MPRLFKYAHPAMGKIVAKFGGSSLRKPEDLAKLVSVVKLYGESLVVVVSAFFGVTNSLIGRIKSASDEPREAEAFIRGLMDMKKGIIEASISQRELREGTMSEARERLARLERFFLGVGYLGDVPDFAYDAALSYGERLSSLVIAAALKSAGIDAEEVLPEDMGLTTDGEFGNAACDFNVSEARVAARLSGEGVFVVPGFYGLSPEGKTTLFGRGGSDYSAAAIARCIGASSLDVWKDVDGFLSADPGIVEKPLPISHLDYTEAAELSYFGAKILHPRTVEPLEGKGIPIRIMNIEKLSRGLKPFTVIDGREEVAAGVVKSVTHSDDIGVLRLSGPGLGFKHGILARTTALLDQKGINIKSVLTAQTCINLLVSSVELEEAFKAVRELHDSAVCDLEMLSDISIIAVVGNGLFDRRGTAVKALSAVSEAGVHVLIASAGASKTAVYLITRRDELAKAIKAIHMACFGGE